MDISGEKIRILALDFGLKRIGMAVSDPLGITAQGVRVLERKGKKQDIPMILKVIEEYRVGRILVGLPMKLNLKEGTIQEDARRFGELLAKASGLPVVFHDERLTTAEAERLLISADVSRAKRKGVIDMMAAQIMLQSYLDSGKGV